MVAVPSPSSVVCRALTFHLRLLRAMKAMSIAELVRLQIGSLLAHTNYKSSDSVAGSVFEAGSGEFCVSDEVPLGVKKFQPDERRPGAAVDMLE